MNKIYRNLIESDIPTAVKIMIIGTAVFGLVCLGTAIVIILLYFALSSVVLSIILSLAVILGVIWFIGWLSLEYHDYY